MKIINFKMSNTEHLNYIIKNSYDITSDIIRECLKLSNVSFIIQNLNRLQSMLLCELGCSYIQQSQPYVHLDTNSYVHPNGLPEEDSRRVNRMIGDSFRLYEEMTQLKDPNKKGRLTSDDFVHGITYEDARYILPLATTTTMTVTMSGDKLVDLYKMCHNYQYIMGELIDELQKYMPTFIHSKLVGLIYYYSPCEHIDNTVYGPFLKSINEGDVIPIHVSDDTVDIYRGACISTNNKPSLENIYENKMGELIDRVSNNYGHKSILEQSRTTYGMSCSLSTYHQVIRHRLQSIHREDLSNILYDTDRKYYIPESIANHYTYSMRFNNLVERYKDYIEKIARDINSEKIYPLLLNCFYIKFMVSSNARNDEFIFRERLCQNAQKEIRDLYDKKYQSLVEISPDIYKKAVPPCVYGKCKEGGLSCGKADEMKKKYFKD